MNDFSFQLLLREILRGKARQLRQKLEQMSVVNIRTTAKALVDKKRAKKRWREKERSAERWEEKTLLKTEERWWKEISGCDPRS